MASGPAIITGPQTLCVAMGTGGVGDASTLPAGGKLHI